MMGGAPPLSPSPLAGGRRRRTRKMSKKLRKMLKALKMKGGLEVDEGVQGSSGADEALGSAPEFEEPMAAEEPPADAGRRRRRRTRRRRSHRRSRAGLFA